MILIDIFCNVFFWDSFDMQVSITKSAWSELFALGLIQSQDLLSLGSVMSGILLNHQLNSPNNTVQLVTVAEHMTKIQSFLRSAIQLNMDDYEIAAMKALVLFSPGECFKKNSQIL